jgi:hypothetical protein
MLDATQIKRCRGILYFDNVTNFEQRMVAEINLYWIVFEDCSASSFELPATQARLQAWRQEWSFLFGRRMKRSNASITD